MDTQRFQANNEVSTDGVKAIAMQVGKKREEQQDAVAFGEGFLVVADGMGGQPDGADASWNAVIGATMALERLTPLSKRQEINGVADAARKQVAFMHERRRYGRYDWNWPATTDWIPAPRSRWGRTPATPRSSSRSGSSARRTRGN